VIPSTAGFGSLQALPCEVAGTGTLLGSPRARDWMGQRLAGGTRAQQPANERAYSSFGLVRRPGAARAKIA
jgi:hypothetical protein